MASSCGLGGGVVLPNDPSNNSVLTATPAFGGVDVSWTLPSTNPFAIAHTIIYRAVASNFDLAMPLAVSGGNLYYDKNELGTPIEYFYWIRFISINGTQGELIGPASATARPTIEKMLELLTGVINTGHLALSLREELNQITLNGQAIQDEIAARLLSSEALADALTIVQGNLDNAVTLISEEVTARQEYQEALVTQLNTIAVGNDENAAAILAEQTARVSADDALAEDINILYTETENNTAAIIAESSARTTQYDSLASTLTSVQAAVETKASIYRQNTPPASPDEGDLWYDNSANILLWSEQMQQAGVWSQVDVASVVANGATAPDGEATADIVNLNAIANARIDQSTNVPAVAGDTWTFSIWLRGTGTIRICIQTSTGVGGFTETIAALSSTWTRYSATVTFASGATGYVRAMVIRRAADTSTQVVPWGAQVEPAAQAGRYIKREGDVNLKPLNSVYYWTGTDWETASDVSEALAAVQTEATARAAADSVLASQITTAETTLNGNIAAVETALEANIEAVGDTVTEIGALYTAKVNVNGLVGGFGIYNDGTEVEAGFDVDRFWIGSGSDDKIKPFIVEGDEVFINQAVINQLVFNKLRSAEGDVIVEDGKIKSDYLQVVRGLLIGTDSNNGLSLDETSLVAKKAGNTQFSIDNLGNVYARGDIQATSLKADSVNIVTTAHLAGDVLMVPRNSQFNASSLGAGLYTLCAVNVSNLLADSKVALMFRLKWIFQSGSTWPSVVNITLKRNGVNIWNSNVFESLTERVSITTPDSWGGNTVTWLVPMRTYLDIPGAGSHTYTFVIDVQYSGLMQNIAAELTAFTVKKGV